MSRFQCFSILEKMNKGHLKISKSTINNDQTLMYSIFNKIIKGPGTSFQIPALKQKHVRNVYHTVH